MCWNSWLTNRSSSHLATSPPGWTFPKPQPIDCAPRCIEANLITQEPVTRRYMLSSHALWVGSGYLRHSPTYRAAFFPMQELARQFPGTVQLGVLDQDYVLFIHSVGYAGAPDCFADVGLRRPLNATASGKIFLAGMMSEEVDRIMAKCTEKYTDSTITSSSQMRQELAQVQEAALRPQRRRTAARLLGVGGGRGFGPGRSAGRGHQHYLAAEEFSPEREASIARAGEGSRTQDFVAAWPSGRARA